MKNKKIYLLILPSILLISVVSTSLPLFVGTNIKLDINPKVSPSYSPIHINSPQSTTYTGAMAGYYAATHGFEDTQNGYVPHDWTEYSPGDARVKVESSAGGHNKVLRLYDPFQWWYFYPYAQATTSFSNQPYGKIEFWFRTTSVASPTTIYLKDGSSNRITLRVYANKWQYYDTSWHDIQGLLSSTQPNQWYHIQIDFDASTSKYMGLNHDTWRITINDDTSKPMNFRSSGDYVDTLIFKTDGPAHSYSTYIDAVGYSWDTYYDIHDNKYPGLLLEFEPDSLEYMQYTLDGQTREIEGDIVLTMPKSGSHVISVYGRDQSGWDYWSGDLSFSVSYSEKIAVMLYSSDAGGVSGDPFNSEQAEYYIREEYKNILAGQGYSKFYIFRDLSSQTLFDNLITTLTNKRIDEQDELFFYIRTHGTYSGYYSESYSCLTYHNNFYLSASHYLQQLKLINTDKICSLVDACYSGWFAKRLNLYPFLGISAADEDSPSVIHGITREAVFSADFFDRVYWGDNAIEAFNHAANSFYVVLYNMNPLCYDNTPTGFMFFD